MVLVAVEGKALSLQQAEQEQRQNAFDTLMTRVRTVRPLTLEFVAETPGHRLSLPEDEQ